MADVTVDINEGYIQWLGAAPDSPVNVVLDAVADLVLEAAKAHAPVSRRGSRYAPPGFLRSKIIVAERERDDSGELARFVGTRLNKHGGARNYPFPFIANDAGLTWNRGRKSRRSAINYFIAEALDEVPFTTYEI